MPRYKVEATDRKGFVYYRAFQYAQTEKAAIKLVRTYYAPATSCRVKWAATPTEAGTK